MVPKRVQFGSQNCIFNIAKESQLISKMIIFLQHCQCPFMFFLHTALSEPTDNTVHTILGIAVV
jgi:hypothetical protein